MTFAITSMTLISALMTLSYFLDTIMIMKTWIRTLNCMIVHEFDYDNISCFFYITDYYIKKIVSIKISLLPLLVSTGTLLLTFISFMTLTLQEVQSSHPQGRQVHPPSNSPVSSSTSQQHSQLGQYLVLHLQAFFISLVTSS